MAAILLEVEVMPLVQTAMGLFVANYGGGGPLPILVQVIDYSQESVLPDNAELPENRDAIKPQPGLCLAEVFWGPSMEREPEMCKLAQRAELAASCLGVSSDVLNDQAVDYDEEFPFPSTGVAWDVCGSCGDVITIVVSDDYCWSMMLAEWITEAVADHARYCRDMYDAAGVMYLQPTRMMQAKRPVTVGQSLAA